jgi:hypothetical protein
VKRGEFVVFLGFLVVLCAVLTSDLLKIWWSITRRSYCSE